MKKIKELDEKIFLLCVVFIMLIGLFEISTIRKTSFDAQNAFYYLTILQSKGPRIPGYAAHDMAVDFITSTLHKNGWQVEIQAGEVNGHPYRNIIGKMGTQATKLLLGSHYDSRLIADNDHNPDWHNYQVPGANDGGSSTAVLLELSRILAVDNRSGIALVFFDIEDQGRIDGWDWILGSREYVKRNSAKPRMMVLLDMVGGHNQTIQPPSNSDKEIYRQIQQVAAQFKYDDHFLNASQGVILDDHVPFLEAGVPSVNLIDIVDPNWHTTQDDLENVSIFSLQRIGDTLIEWINHTH